MKLTFEEKIKFGISYLWPLSDGAKAITELLKRKCLRNCHLPYLKRMGHQIVIVFEKKS